jgi:hypothetical protein
LKRRTDWRRTAKKGELSVAQFISIKLLQAFPSLLLLWPATLTVVDSKDTPMFVGENGAGGGRFNEAARKLADK